MIVTSMDELYDWKQKQNIVLGLEVDPDQETTSKILEVDPDQETTSKIPEVDPDQETTSKILSGDTNQLGQCSE